MAYGKKMKKMGNSKGMSYGAGKMKRKKTSKKGMTPLKRRTR